MTITDAVLRSTPLSSISDPSNPLYQAITGLLDGPPTKSGVTVNETSAMRSAAVYRSVSLLAGSLAGLPTKLNQVDDETKTPVRLNRHRAIWSVKPNPNQTQFELRETFFTRALLSGQGAQVKFRNPIGEVVELWNLDPRKRLKVGLAPDGQKVFEIDGKPYTDEDIFHLPAISVNGVTGVGPIQAAREVVGIGLAADEYAALLWSQGTLTDGTINTDANLSPLQAAQIQRAWMKSHTSLRVARRVAVLDNGATYNPVSLSPADAQFLEARQFQVRDIARLFGIPPSMLGDNDGSSNYGTGLEEQALGFITFTLLPWIERLEQRYQFELTGDEYQVRLIVDGLARARIQERWAAFRAGLNGGVWNPDEIRSFLELPPRTDGAGGQYVTPVNMATDEQIQLRILKEQAEVARALTQAGYSLDSAALVAGLPEGLVAAGEGGTTVD